MAALDAVTILTRTLGQIDGEWQRREGDRPA